MRDSLGTWICLAVSLLVGCGNDLSPGWEFMPDMAHSIPYDAFAPNPITGQTLRSPAPGTVPRGRLPFPYGPGPEQAELAGLELTNPVPRSEAALERGEALFNTFCRVCHGPSGAGDGPMVPPFPAPPAYDSPSVRDQPAGYVYHVIVRGTGRMPPYAAQILPEDRWRLVHWVQVLQQSRGDAAQEAL